MQPLLVDTCLAIWLVEDAPVAEPAVLALDVAARQGSPVFVSPISAWEVGLLVARRRLSLDVPVTAWFDRLLAVAGAKEAPMPPHVLVGASFLPGHPPNDPADRIIAATARDLDATLMTRDRLLLGYARQGHIRAIAC